MLILYIALLALLLVRVAPRMAHFWGNFAR
jgi:hypothetical protein